MAKQVRETTAGGQISAFVVLNKKGEHVATVNAHYSNGGRVSVDVWNIGEAVARSFDTADKNGKVSQASRDDRSRSEWSLFGLQQSSASGYGYDKFAAALAGLIIDGHTMANHCGQVPECEKARQSLMRAYLKPWKEGVTQKDWDIKARKLGASFANYRTENGRYMSLHFETGLRRLELFGYQVIQAI